MAVPYSALQCFILNSSNRKARRVISFSIGYVDEYPWGEQVTSEWSVFFNFYIICSLYNIAIKIASPMKGALEDHSLNIKKHEKNQSPLQLFSFASAPKEQAFLLGKGE